MILVLAAGTLLAIAPPTPAGEILVCGRSMRFEDQYCAALMEGRPWSHAEAAQAHESYARYALPHRAGAAWLAAANNWIAAGEPARAVTAFDRALAAGLTSNQRAEVRLARRRAAREAQLSAGR